MSPVVLLGAVEVAEEEPKSAMVVEGECQEAHNSIQQQLFRLLKD